MALGSNKPLTEMSTRIFLGDKGRPARKADNVTAIREPTVSTKYGTLDVSQPYGPSGSVSGISLPFLPFTINNHMQRWRPVVSFDIAANANVHIFISH
jgi:hypothetical protein